MTILGLSEQQARSYFMDSKCYCSIALPSYVEFKNVLAAAEQCAKRTQFSTSLYKALKQTEGVNYTLTSNKDGKYAWRPLQLIHPLVYFWLVKDLTSKDSWQEICDKFLEFRKVRNVRCVSCPVARNRGATLTASQIRNWWLEYEQGSLGAAIKFRRMIITDVADCYGSLYTHSIPWALHGKSVAQAHPTDELLLGNRIDKLLRAMRCGQTNGIPQGSGLMDFLAEIVLGYADVILDERIKKLKIRPSAYLILRYRDDYRIFVNDLSVGEAILKALTESLASLGMRLNSAKTRVSDDVIRDSVKVDKVAWWTIQNEYESLSVEKKLLVLYDHSVRYPNCGSLMGALQKLHEQLQEKKTKDCKEQRIASIAVATEIAYRNPKCYHMGISVLAELLKDFSKADKRRIGNDILSKFRTLPNTGYLEVWLQRILRPCGVKLDYAELLCEKVEDVSSQIWNNAWLQSKPRVERALSEADIIDRDELKKTSSTMSRKEIDVFVKNFDQGYLG